MQTIPICSVRMGPKRSSMGPPLARNQQIPADDRAAMRPMLSGRKPARSINGGPRIGTEMLAKAQTV